MESLIQPSTSQKLLDGVLASAELIRNMRTNEGPESTIDGLIGSLHEQLIALAELERRFTPEFRRKSEVVRDFCVAVMRDDPTVLNRHLTML